jgi:hypothetical protein
MHFLASQRASLVARQFPLALLAGPLTPGRLRTTEVVDHQAGFTL